MTTELVDAAITRIEQKMLALGEREIDSRRLGEMVMEELRKLDKVAYIRFASVYKSFSDVEDFRDAIREVRDKSSRMFSAEDHAFMARAIALTERGRDTAHAQSERGLRDRAGRPRHRRGLARAAGEAHAEASALAACTRVRRRRDRLRDARALQPPGPHAALRRCARRREGRRASWPRSRIPIRR